MITFLVRLFSSTVKHTRGKKKTAKSENVNLEYCDTGTGLHHQLCCITVMMQALSKTSTASLLHLTVVIILCDYIQGFFLGEKNHKIFRNKFYSIWSSDVIQVDHKTVFFFFFKDEIFFEYVRVSQFSSLETFTSIQQLLITSVAVLPRYQTFWGGRIIFLTISPGLFLFLKINVTKVKVVLWEMESPQTQRWKPHVNGGRDNPSIQVPE